VKSGSNPIGIFGGTFDPVHFGHLRLAQEVAEYCNLESVRMIPAGMPPHRLKPRSDPTQRFEMVEIATAGNSILTPDDREIGKKTPCYSVETLIELRSEFGMDKPICLMVGADAFLGFSTWHEWERLFDLAHVIVARRPGFDLALKGALAGQYEKRRENDPDALRHVPAGKILTVDITPLDISSSAIRDYFARDKSARYLLPDAVLDYIRNHGLYREKHAV
jgi:nicotinate-nucleotide adenylyltransferase